jgi:hypothetical protein
LSASVLNGNSETGSFSLTSKNGSVNLTGGTIVSSGYLTVNSGDGILLDGAGQSFAAANTSFTAVNTVNIQNSDLSSVAYLNAVAKTITVINTIFNPTHAYNFGTTSGNANINNGVTLGSLNLINDHLGSTAVTSSSQINFTGGPSSQAGINSYATATH